MGIIDKIQALGCQLKLIKLETNGGDNPKKITTKTISLKQLTSEINMQTMEVLSQSPAELCTPFEKIFESAGIHTDQKKWNFDHLRNMLVSGEFQKLDDHSLQDAILKKLTEEKADIEEMVKDAIARDQSLDAFEQLVIKKMDERGVDRQARISEIETEIRKLNDETAKLVMQNKNDQDCLTNWRKEKEKYEDELEGAIELLTQCKKHQHKGD